MSNCPICEKHKSLNVPIYEDEHWIITHGPLESQILGYLYLEPKRHVEDWSEFTHEELAQIGPLVKKVEVALKQELDIDRIYVVTISEAVRHLHFHLIPRKSSSDVKGLPLIEQATQQVVKTKVSINKKEYFQFYKIIKKYFS